MRKLAFEIKKKKKSLRYKTKDGWKKALAPLYDQKFQISLRAMKYLLEKLYLFQNIKEEKTEVIPLRAFRNGVRDPAAKLPTIRLIANSPLFPSYNKLQKSSLSCLYVGDSWFIIGGEIEDESEREILENLAFDIKALFPRILECLERRDYLGAQKIFNDYYGIAKIPLIEQPGMERPKTEEAPKPIELKEAEKPIFQTEIPIESREIEKERIRKRPKRGIEKPEEVKVEEKIKPEIPEYTEEMKGKIDEYLKEKYNPGNFLEEVVPRMIYETIIGMAWEEEIRKEATRIYYLYIQRGCKRDSIGDLLYQRLSEIKNKLQSKLSDFGRIKKAQQI